MVVVEKTRTGAVLLWKQVLFYTSLGGEKIRNCFTVHVAAEMWVCFSAGPLNRVAETRNVQLKLATHGRKCLFFTWYGQYTYL